MLLALLAFAGLDSQQVCPDRVTVAAAATACPLHLFFDSGEAEIRREWNPVIEQAAGLAKGGRRLLIVGHSDTPGSAAANRRVAQRRAETVAAALVAVGVPATSLELRSAGESQLLVPTAEGVREIQNRRVAITPLP